jgi:hypothetical protein
LENVSKLLFKKHYRLITDLTGTSPGIYALYDDGELYYVGKSTDLRKRVKHHLRDRHYAAWSHFSLYLVRRAEHIGEIESLIVRISNPKGNRVKPKSESTAILKNLKALVKQKQQAEFKEMFGIGTPKRKRQRAISHPKTLKGLVLRRKHIFATYKGREYKAVVTPGGKIKLGGKLYKSPTAAAKKIVDRRTVNGWRFWYLKDPNGEWVRLSEYRR